METSLTPSMEDYLRTVHALEIEKGSVRVKDIADRMGISMPSVSAAMKNLISRSLVCHQRYDLVKLTATGLVLAEKLENRFVIIRDFLSDVLHVERGVAEKDTCHIEHLISTEAVNKMQAFLGSYRKN